ncbi:MAG: HAMP domain-containing sensor histidine kinase [Myxococcaceae bacterium]
MWALSHYVRAHLHRRLFVWFGVTIFATGAAVFLTAKLTSDGPAPWGRAQGFVAGRFASVWQNPTARTELAHAIATELNVAVSLEDPQGHVLTKEGGTCVRSWLNTPVRDSQTGQALGRVKLCSETHWWEGSYKGFLPFLAALFVLWAAAGKISRRLSRPLMELAYVAKDLGTGNLSARVKLGDRHALGETHVVGVALNDMADRIQKQLQDQRELLATVSHELRTPLARIRLLTELIREAGGASRTVDDLDQEIVEIDALVGDLLASSRVEFGTLNLRELEAADVARRALERTGFEAGALSLEATQSIFQGDATLLARALANLLENARKHGGGEIRLNVRNEGDRIVFEAQDRGSGFAPGEEDQLFRPFYRRAGKPEDESGSLGLGLALVRRIAEAHQGRAYAKSREGGGALVGIELPLRRHA